MVFTKYLADPIEQFKLWYQDAKTANEKDPDAMVLATLNATGQPDARVVLYKGIREDGFLFFTNYQSNKAQQIAENSQVALVFYWPVIYRQVRIAGHAVRVSDDISKQYFASRPYGSQISAWASPQSQQIESREVLLTRREEYQQRFPLGEVPYPEFWGGFCVVPTNVEFWWGCDDRLHDRIRYLKNNKQWQIERLAP